MPGIHGKPFNGRVAGNNYSDKSRVVRRVNEISRCTSFQPGGNSFFPSANRSLGARQKAFTLNTENGGGTILAENGLVRAITYIDEMSGHTVNFFFIKHPAPQVKFILARSHYCYDQTEDFLHLRKNCEHIRKI